MVLRAQQIRFSYGKEEVLAGATFAIHPGEMVGILGPNGCGKSTLFDLLSGVHVWQGGQLYLDEQTVVQKGGRVAPVFRRQLGVLFQGNSLDKKLSAEHNLTYAAQVFGLVGPQIKSRVAEIIRLADLQERRFEPVEKLSFGMQRRLELYRAFLHEPRVIVLDEATAGLDEVHVASFFAFLRSYCRDQEAMILLSTHDSEEIAFCDRVLLLDAGKVVKDTTPEVLRHYLEQNRLDIRLRHDISSALREKIAIEMEGLLKVRFERIGLHILRCFVLDVAFALKSLAELYGLDMVSSLQLHKPTMADVYNAIARKNMQKEIQKRERTGHGYEKEWTAPQNKVL